MGKKNKTIIQKPAIAENKNFRVPVLIIITALVVWAWFLLSAYFKTANIPASVVNYYFDLSKFTQPFGPENIIVLLQNAWNLLSAIFIVFAAYAIGKHIFSVFKIAVTSLSERIIFSISLGLGAIFFVAYFFGVCGFFYSWIFIPMILLFNVFGLLDILLSKNKEAFQTSPALGFEKILLLPILAFAVVVLIGSFAPETFYDSLIVHIGKPNFWLQNHKIMPDETIVTSCFFPGNVNILYSFGLMFGDERSCKVLHYLFSILTAMVIYVAGKKFFTKSAGFVGAAIFLTIPYTGIISFRSGMEMPIAFFETLGFFALFSFLKDPQNRKWLILCAINYGIAFGMKHTSLFAAAAAMLVLVADAIFEKRGLVNLVKSLGIFWGVFFAVYMPWMLYSYVHTGNPIHPWLTKYLGGPASSPSRAIDSVTIGIDLFGPKKILKSFLNVFTGPWAITMGKFEEAYPGPLLLLLLPLALFIKSNFKHTYKIFIYIAFYWLVWGVTTNMYFRYFMTAVPVICLLCGAYVALISKNKYVKVLLFTLLVLLMFKNLFLVMNIQKFSNNCLAVSLGYQTKADYLNKMRPSYPTPYYAMAQWINQHTPKDSTVAIMGEQRIFYIERRVIMSDLQRNYPLISWLSESKNEDDYYAKLKNINYILLSVPESVRLASFDLANFEPAELEMFSKFWNKYVREVAMFCPDFENLQQGVFSIKNDVPQYWAQYSANPFNYVYVYEIMSKEEALKPHQAPPNFFLAKNFYKQDRWEKLSKTVERLISESK